MITSKIFSPFSFGDIVSSPVVVLELFRW